ncbi:hypothetical protein PCC7418_0125 [Halothece sp. PCC 7418]|uniref:hypothetical protein n=1 Tax=Halothece sp. (strain PCC 7418) TaxID=65093 RepID=UPI0002A073EB|nr:hypothetical protein [Halothece sp. PCC 7418]AFZ42368.1 hypothetical protein PCC7418_0125 [Halothece sp. PCC 7418]
MSQLQQTIQDILANLKGLSSLKELLAELNYDRANVPLSTRHWSETATEKLADHPLLLATAGEDFHIIYCRLNSNQLRQTDERPIITQLLKEHPYINCIDTKGINCEKWEEEIDEIVAVLYGL